jgi:ornithine carbamoyltransferase
MNTKHILSILDLSSEQVTDVIDRGIALKADPLVQLLNGAPVALLFEKPSLRTRVSFDVAIHQLGGHPLYLSREEVGMGSREPVADVARVLSRFVKGMVVRTFAQETLETLAYFSRVPVINALSDHEHPCQALADLMTIKEKFGYLKGIKIAYIGDSNNVANSLALASASVGSNLVIASPRGYQMDQDLMDKALERAIESSGSIETTEIPEEAVQNADVVYTDVWVSMGQEDEMGERLRAFESYRVDGDLLSKAKDSAIFMHPLPAHSGEEISDGLLESPQSVVFDQAENRMHVQKAVIAELLG